MTLFLETAYAKVPDLNERGARLRFLGRRQHLPSSVLEAMKEAEELTAHNDKLDVYVALNYGGRSEIVDAARRIVQDGLTPEEVDEATFARYLYAPEVPEVDLVIRTSGELRVSNFLLWQIAYAEFYVTDTLWPDFSPEEFLRAIESFASRSRRRGLNPDAQVAGGHRARPRARRSRRHHPWEVGRPRRRAPRRGRRRLRALTRSRAAAVRGRARGRGTSRPPRHSPRPNGHPRRRPSRPPVGAPLARGKARDPHLEAVLAVLLMTLWVGAPLAHLGLFPRSRYGVILILIAVVGPWISDSGAYFAGRFFGRRLLFPSLSPNKTVEGGIGGLLCTMLVVGVVSYQFLDFTLAKAAVIGAGVSIFSQCGISSSPCSSESSTSRTSGTSSLATEGFWIV